MKKDSRRGVRVDGREEGGEQGTYRKAQFYLPSTGGRPIDEDRKAENSNIGGWYAPAAIWKSDGPHARNAQEQ